MSFAATIVVCFFVALAVIFLESIIESCKEAYWDHKRKQYEKKIEEERRKP